MKVRFLITAIIILMVAASCSVQKYSQKNTVIEDVGYLQFNGDLSGKSITLNNQPVTVIPKHKLALKSGTYDLVINKANRQILKRKVMITVGNIVEVSLP
ncbi:MAG: hypothetical protein GX106_07745 [Candidatus Cloacimonetes bacterium]|jgi:hypothetical protein|nr:hypothetical protein [Candidatus Cloacimonadota bacterium]